MVALSDIEGSRIYIDTNLFIYAVEGTDEREHSARSIFALIDAGQASGVTSEITLAECLVVPYREGNVRAQTVYERALVSRPGLEVVPVSRAILRTAAALRANAAIRLPDAIHLATAVTTGCNLVISNDLRLPDDSVKTLSLSDIRP